MHLYDLEEAIPLFILYQHFYLRIDLIKHLILN